MHLDILLTSGRMQPLCVMSMVRFLIRLRHRPNPDCRQSRINSRNANAVSSSNCHISTRTHIRTPVAGDKMMVGPVKSLHESNRHKELQMLMCVVGSLTCRRKSEKTCASK